MNEPDVMVYLMTGFLDSGKSQFLKFTLTQDYFQIDGTTLLILCEEGEEEFDPLEMAKHGVKIIKIEEQEELTDKYIKMLQVKTASRETPIKSLSGGNQQKVILGRWLMTEPDFLILDEPTRGIDVGTKTEIQKLVVKLANEGMSVVFISSEVEEMLRTVTHMGILRDGEKVGELEESELSQENVMKAIAGGDK